MISILYGTKRPEAANDLYEKSRVQILPNHRKNATFFARSQEVTQEETPRRNVLPKPFAGNLQEKSTGILLSDQIERSFSMKYNKKEFEQYPEIMNKEQMRVACHISKRTALYLLQANLIPHTSTGKKTRCYSIKKKDIIAFMCDREINPDKYIAPKNWYRSNKTSHSGPSIRIHPELSQTPEMFHQFYESMLSSFPDVMNVAQVVSFTGYNRRTVCQWIRLKKLRALQLSNKLMIPRNCLIEWLCSEEYDQIIRKSKIHIDMLWAMQQQ